MFQWFSHIPAAETCGASHLSMWTSCRAEETFRWVFTRNLLCQDKARTSFNKLNILPRVLEGPGRLIKVFESYSKISGIGTVGVRNEDQTIDENAGTNTLVFS